MSIQILTASAILSNFVDCPPSSYPVHPGLILASSLDYGFDFDEDELGRELLAPLPNGLSSQPNVQVDADEFEFLFRWFNG